MPRRPTSVSRSVSRSALLAPALVASLVALLGLVTSGAACSSSTEVTGPAVDAAVDLDAADASDAASGKDANGPGQTGETCTFNRDCQAALRCECSEADGCACKEGVRGTGKNGVDPCPGDDGSNACESALCVEGPDGTGSFCSDECVTDEDCTGPLPVCSSIALLGRVCVRKAKE